MWFVFKNKMIENKMRFSFTGSGDNRILIYKAESGEKVIEKQVCYDY